MVLHRTAILLFVQDCSPNYDAIIKGRTFLLLKNPININTIILIMINFYDNPHFIYIHHVSSPTHLLYINFKLNYCLSKHFWKPNGTSEITELQLSLFVCISLVSIFHFEV